MGDPQAMSPAGAEHARLVVQLQRPGALPAGSGPVQVLQTHLSTLLLAGDRVYKLKQPVTFGFVDFSTLQARHQACLEELRLNRRTAPGHYLAVLPVVATADGARLLASPGPPAEPVLDWALQMRRFDETEGFDRLAERGELRAEQVDALAAAVARFHAAQPASPASLGAAGIARDWARANLAELATLVAGDADRAAVVARLADWTEQRGAALAARMDERAADGHVREVHGDLHLGNVVWHDGAPLVFDAIEFNPSLRHIDTVGDLAFTFMDLLAHGLDGLAWRFISAAVETAGDHAALPLLHWWAVYRAAVRAKVAWLAPSGDAADARARRCLQVAQALAAAQPLAGPPPAPPWLVLTLGLSGSGKSAVALVLVAQLGLIRLRSDVERKRLFGLAPTDRVPPALGLYGPEATHRTYDRLLALADLALAAGIGVVVDAASLRRQERLAFAQLAERRGAAHVLLWCQAPETVLQARIAARQARGADASDATAEVLALQQRVAEWPGPDEQAHTWVLVTDAPPDEVARRCARLPWHRPVAG
jgi:uncharacterized protein